MIFDGKRLLEQLEYGMDHDIYSGCSIFEMIVVLCYCSLRKKGVSPIHFIALYHEYSGKFQRFEKNIRPLIDSLVSKQVDIDIKHSNTVLN